MAMALHVTAFDLEGTSPGGPDSSAKWGVISDCPWCLCYVVGLYFPLPLHIPDNQVSLSAWGPGPGWELDKRNLRLLRETRPGYWLQFCPLFSV